MIPAAAAAREPLDGTAVARAVLRPGGLWQAVEVVDGTGSTNADLLARALGGAPEGLVLAAEEQSAGRGRMGRTWVSPPRAALTFSLLVRPVAVPPARRGWLPLLAGVAVASAVTAVTGVQTRLKWPNDVLAGPAKLAGILAEAAGDAVVVGVGLNVSTGPGELPPPGPGALAATSLRIAAPAAPEIAARRPEAGWQRLRQSPSQQGTAAHRDPGRLRALVPGLVPGRAATPSAAGCGPGTPSCPARSAAVSGPNCPAVRCSPGWPSASTRTAGCWSACRPAPCSRWRPATSSTCADPPGDGRGANARAAARHATGTAGTR